MEICLSILRIKKLFHVNFFEKPLLKFDVKPSRQNSIKLKLLSLKVFLKIYSGYSRPSSKRQSFDQPTGIKDWLIKVSSFFLNLFFLVSQSKIQCQADQHIWLVNSDSWYQNWLLYIHKLCNERNYIHITNECWSWFQSIPVCPFRWKSWSAAE